LIAPNEQASYYQSSTISKRILTTSEYSLAFSKLNTKQNNPLEDTQFPEKKMTTVQGKIFKLAK
jgi:hypothetical protein